MLRAGQEDDLCRVERAQMRLRKASLSTGEENRAILSNIFMGNISSSTRAVLKEREMEGFQVYPLMSVVVLLRELRFPPIVLIMITLHMYVNICLFQINQ